MLPVHETEVIPIYSVASISGAFYSLTRAKLRRLSEAPSEYTLECAMKAGKRPARCRARELKQVAR
jgi:hypothetical protein